MGKTRGHGSRRGAYRGRGKGDDDEEQYEPVRLGNVVEAGHGGAASFERSQAV